MAGLLWRGVCWALFCVLAFIVLYLLAIPILGLLPAHRHWKPPTQGEVTVWLITNGVHASLVFPANALGVDWFAWLPPQQTLARTRGKAIPANFDHVSFGWGDRRFFLNTPRWRDLKVSTALWAASGLDATLMHVEYLPEPIAADDAVPFQLSRAQYVQLAAYVQSAFAPDAAGRPQQIAEHSYGDFDVFFEARGHYNLFFTCNEWVRRALSDIGVRVPLWSPLDRPLFWQLRAGDARG
ncbi:TIGR02117 family protein [Uliginosibacterium sp. sgz301328]|uniref:TIGR02117 family protein n=1 Tax=Uliginosibacterium sp. sgz301328 TaxID=3243764 RepID=UPI00359D2D09